jgi:hypothetical protein
MNTRHDKRAVPPSGLPAASIFSHASAVKFFFYRRGLISPAEGDNFLPNRDFFTADFLSIKVSGIFNYQYLIEK